MSRLQRGKNDAKDAAHYVQRSKERITYQAAANAWSRGVPWADALPLARRAIEKASAKPKAIPKGKARARV